MGWEYSRANRLCNSYNPTGSTSLATPAWTYTLPGGREFTSAPVISNHGIVYFGQRISGTFQGFLTSLDNAGALRWTIDLTAVFGFVISAYELGTDSSGRPFFCTGDGVGQVVINEDGTIAWSALINQGGARPVCDLISGKFYVECTDIGGNWNILEYDSAGALLNTFIPDVTAFGDTRQGAIGLAGDGSIYLISANNDQEIVKSNESGTLDWNVTPEAFVDPYGPYAIDDTNGRLLYGEYTGAPPVGSIGTLKCLDTATGAELWHYDGIWDTDNNSPSMCLSPAIDATGDIYIQSTWNGGVNAKLVKLDGTNGAVLWTKTYAAVVVAHAGLVSLGSDGLIWCPEDALRINPADGSTLETFALPTSIFDSNGAYQPAIGDNLLLIANLHDNTVYAFAESTPPPPPPSTGAWHLFDTQPSVDENNHVELEQKYREPYTLRFEIKDELGDYIPENKNSPLNYNSLGVYDPLLDEARKILWRVGVGVYDNLAAGIVPTSTHAPDAGALADLTDGILNDYTIAPVNYARFDINNSSFQLKIDLGAAMDVHHLVLRFGSCTNAAIAGVKFELPDTVTVELSPDNAVWSPVRVGARPVGGVSGDWQDSYPGIAVEECFCDLLETTGLSSGTRYVRVTIATTRNIKIALDEFAVYGAAYGTPAPVTFLGENLFVGYLGDSIDLSNDGVIKIQATDVLKKLMDNNSMQQLTPAYYQTDATDIIYSLLTSAACWRSQAEYNSPFTVGEVGWTFGSNLSGLVFPVWQSQANNMLGYVQELAHSIGQTIYADGDGVIQLGNPPYRQISPDRVYIAAPDGNWNARNCVRHRTGKEMRNTVQVSTGALASGLTGAGFFQQFEPNSVARYGERTTGIKDPILSTFALRDNIAQYFLRDYAWNVKALDAQIQPDFDTRLRRFHAFRAVARPNLYPNFSTVAGALHDGELWSLMNAKHHFTESQWYANCSYIPYFPYTTDAPNLQSFQSAAGVTSLQPTWVLSADPLVVGYKVYISNVSEVSGYRLAAAQYGAGVTTDTYNPNYGVIPPAATPIVLGDRYWCYVTAVNAQGFESLPSQILNTIAGTNINPGTDCDGSGSGSGYVITDWTPGLSLRVGPDPLGFYTYQFFSTWTSPICGNTQNKFTWALDALPIDVDNYSAWGHPNDSWNWWAPDRIQAGLEWDNATPGLLDFQFSFRVQADLTGRRIYLRNWNSKMTRDWRPVPGNIAFIDL